jgi:hypothetical protein
MTTWPWQPAPTAPRRPHAMLAVFSTGPLVDEPLSLARFGAPSAEHIADLDVRAIPRAADPAWFDGWRTGALRSIASTDLGAPTALDAADHVHLVIAAPNAPPDLGYLQAAWAVARWMIARGATVVLDVHAHTFWAATAVPAPAATLDVAREVRVIFETEATRTERAHALHTRGLRKFGAPELVALCGQPDAAVVGNVIRALAAEVAAGRDLEEPHLIAVAPGHTWQVVADRDGLAELLQLNHPARVLVDAHGRHLVGAAARALAGPPS